MSNICNQIGAIKLGQLLEDLQELIHTESLTKELLVDRMNLIETEIQQITEALKAI